MKVNLFPGKKLARYLYFSSPLLSGCKIFFLFSFIISTNYSIAQSWKFDFGSGFAAKGYTKVIPGTKFSFATGFGFDQGAVLNAVVRKGNDILRSDYITSNKPFYFSVKVPEGNYNIKIILGDKEGTSATTVRTENRRLFLQNIQTKKGAIIEKIITVHIRDSVIRNKKGEMISAVRLKPRESGYLHWDNLLTIEFNDSLPKVCGIEITKNTSAPTIFLAGNSTVVDQDREPWAAWGQMFPSFFIPSVVAIANYAESGETLKAFKAEKRLDKVWSMAKPGDYLFIEFAHNDQKPGNNFLDPFTTYKSTLKEWIAEARSRKITPVLVTSMHRRSFDSSGHIINTLLDYPEAMRQTAKEEHVALIDLNAMSKILYEAWGPVNSVKAFVHYPANTFPGQDKELKDDTHFNPYGAYELARGIVQSIKEQHLPLEKFLKKNISFFSPAKPDAFEKWYWPLTTFTSSVKPEGN